jgi:hypothetical protein
MPAGGQGRRRDAAQGGVLHGKRRAWSIATTLVPPRGGTAEDARRIDDGVRVARPGAGDPGTYRGTFSIA